MFSGICLSEPLVTHEASGVPIGSKNEFDLKHYINDLKCFETFFFFFFPNRGGRGGSDPIWKIPLIFFFFFLTPFLINLPPLPSRELSEYEQIREDIIAHREREWIVYEAEWEKK